jgi:hypothetical protein
MANDLRITDAVANAMMDALHTAFGDTGILRIYEGNLSAGTPAAPAGTLLAELTMNGTSFGNAAPSTTFSRITAGAITADSSANAAGTAGCFVLFDSAGTTAKLAGTVGTSGCDATIDNATIAAGANVACSAMYVQIPKGWSS